MMEFPENRVASRPFGRLRRCPFGAAMWGILDGVNEAKALVMELESQGRHEEGAGSRPATDEQPVARSLQLSVMI